MDFIDDLGLIQKIYLLEIYLSVSFWEYVSFQKKTNTIKYNIEYGYYSLIQWLAIAVGLLSIFGIFTGFLVLGFCLIVLQYLSHFTLGLILDKISRYNKKFTQGAVGWEWKKGTVKYGDMAKDARDLDSG